MEKCINIQNKISENENRKDFTFSEKMRWADQLKGEHEKIARANTAANLPNGKTLPLGNDVGRVRDKLASDLDLGSGEQFRKDEYVYQNATEKQIRELDAGELSINSAYTQLNFWIFQNEQSKI